MYAVLDAENLAVRWQREFRRLPADVDRLVIWNPNDLTDQDWNQLLTWVRDGGTAILAADGLASRLGGRTDLDTAATASPAAVDPALAGVQTVATGGGIFTSPRPGALAHLTTSNGTPVLISWPEGQGRIYWSADAAWLTNGLVGQEQNLDLALGLLTPARGKHVAFDEFHHGYQAADRWWQLLRGNLQWFVVVLGLATAVLFWASGARFGAPLPAPPGPSRASVEYIFSMSQLYRRARARSIVLQNLHRSLLRDLSRLLGGLQGLSPQEIARRTAERTGLPAAQVEAILLQTAATQTTDKDLLRLAREVEAIQRSVQNAGFRDQRRPGTGAR